MLAVLQILGRGTCFADIGQMPLMIEAVVCRVLHTFCQCFTAELYDEHKYLPERAAHEAAMEHHHTVGFTGAIGSTAVTHVKWDCCPYFLQRSYTGKEGYPTIAYQATVDHTDRVLGVTRGFVDAQNDKTIICLMIPCR